MRAVLRTVRLLDRAEPDTLPIVKGIPIPTPHVKPGRSVVRATMKALQVGDSFLCTPTQRNKAYPLAKKLGIEITCRDMGNRQVRIWRTA